MSTFIYAKAPSFEAAKVAAKAVETFDDDGVFEIFILDDVPREASLSLAETDAFAGSLRGSLFGAACGLVTAAVLAGMMATPTWTLLLLGGATGAIYGGLGGLLSGMMVRHRQLEELSSEISERNAVLRVSVDSEDDRLSVERVLARLGLRPVEASLVAGLA